MTEQDREDIVSCLRGLPPQHETETQWQAYRQRCEELADKFESGAPRAVGASGQARVWIVEMLHDQNHTWLPTVGCRLSKEDGRRELADWKQRNPRDRFRLTRYAPNEKVQP